MCQEPSRSNTPQFLRSFHRRLCTGLGSWRCRRAAAVALASSIALLSVPVLALLLLPAVLCKCSCNLVQQHLAAQVQLGGPLSPFQGAASTKQKRPLPHQAVRSLDFGHMRSAADAPRERGQLVARARRPARAVYRAHRVELRPRLRLARRGAPVRIQRVPRRRHVLLGGPRRLGPVGGPAARGLARGPGGVALEARGERGLDMLAI